MRWKKAGEEKKRVSYYPFGLIYQKTGGNVVNGREHHYGFNGAEETKELGLNLLEIELRSYDPAIARWTAVDPVTHHSFSPYNAFDNNPVFWADPSGADSDAGNRGIGRSPEMMSMFTTNNCPTCLKNDVINPNNPEQLVEVVVIGSKTSDYDRNAPQSIKNNIVSNYDTSYKESLAQYNIDHGTSYRQGEQYNQYFYDNFYKPELSELRGIQDRATQAAAEMILDASIDAALLTTPVPQIRMASTLLGRFSSRVVAKGGQTIVGEGMKRVSAVAAKNPGSTILNNMPKFSGSPHQVTSQMMQYNRKWLLQQMRSGKSIMDIGLDPTRGAPSIFYQMEQNMMKNYLKLHPNAFQIIK